MFYRVNILKTETKMFQKSHGFKGDINDNDLTLNRLKVTWRLFSILK